MIDTKGYDVGYGKPPVHSRWKKGECGNPKRRQQSAPGAAELIEAQFNKKIFIRSNGENKRVTGFEAIVTQLWSKEVRGDRRALGVRLKYLAFARKNVTSDLVIELQYQTLGEEVGDDGV